MTETFDPSDPVSEIRTLVSEIAQALVDDPAAVKVEVILDQDTAVLRLEVAPATKISPVTGFSRNTKAPSAPDPPKKLLQMRFVQLGSIFRMTASCNPPPKLG